MDTYITTKRLQFVVAAKRLYGVDTHEISRPQIYEVIGKNPGMGVPAWLTGHTENIVQRGIYRFPDDIDRIAAAEVREEIKAASQVKKASSPAEKKARSQRYDYRFLPLYEREKMRLQGYREEQAEEVSEAIQERAQQQTSVPPASAAPVEHPTAKPQPASVQEEAPRRKRGRPRKNAADEKPASTKENNNKNHGK
jgi:hypothetical protein